MKEYRKFVMGIFLIINLNLVAQSYQERKIPDFIEGRTTGFIWATSFDEVRHIVYSGNRMTGLSDYYYIDHGYIGGEEYKYYISRDGKLVMGIPLSFPNYYYAISICAYQRQNGWASEEYVRSEQERNDCW